MISTTILFIDLFHENLNSINERRKIDNLITININITTKNLNEVDSLILKFSPSIIFLFFDNSLKIVDQISAVFKNKTHKYPFVKLILMINSNKYLSLECFSEIEYDGIMLTKSNSQDLERCVKEVLKGRKFVQKKFMPAYEKINTKEENELTEQEFKILTMLAEGKQNIEIGRTLFISPNTVKNHKANMKVKLKLKTTFELVQYAIKSLPFNKILL